MDDSPNLHPPSRKTKVEIPIVGEMEPMASEFFKSASGGDGFLPAKATVVREWLSNRKSKMQPWRVFCATSKISPPSGPAVATRRVVANIDKFSVNYIVVAVVLLCYCVLTSPMLIFALLTSLGLLYFARVRYAETQLKIAGREVTPAVQYGAVAAISFPLFYLAGAGSAVFWVIGASVVFVLLHAVLYASEPDPAAAFLEEV